MTNCHSFISVQNIISKEMFNDFLHNLSGIWSSLLGNLSNLKYVLEKKNVCNLTTEWPANMMWINIKQECIPVGCVPPAHWPYLIVSEKTEKTTHAPPAE